MWLRLRAARSSAWRLLPRSPALPVDANLSVSLSDGNDAPILSAKVGCARVPAHTAWRTLADQPGSQFNVGGLERPDARQLVFQDLLVAPKRGLRGGQRLLQRRAPGLPMSVKRCTTLSCLHIKYLFAGHAACRAVQAVGSQWP